MRKIYITESQWKQILESEGAYPLDLKGDDGKPENFTEYEVAVDNTDPDAPNDVTSSETIKRSKPGWFGMGRYPAMHRLPEGKELDNAENSGYGLEGDAYIQDAASTGKGKMAVNVNAEVKSDTRGSRNNTNQVRASRMREYKKTNPALYKKNGGDKMLQILDTQTDKQSSIHKNMHSGETKKMDTTPKAFGEETGENGAFYFK